MNILKILFKILFIFFIVAWYLTLLIEGNDLILVSTIILLIVLLKRRKKHYETSVNYEQVDKMDGVDFEVYIANALECLGYKIELTPASHDYGADVIASYHNELTVVQCKRYKGKVGISAVQEVLGAKGYYKATKAIVVTNSYFTNEAIKLADATQVQLIDRTGLEKLLAE